MVKRDEDVLVDGAQVKRQPASLACFTAHLTSIGKPELIKPCRLFIGWPIGIAMPWAPVQRARIPDLAIVFHEATRALGLKRSTA